MKKPVLTSLAVTVLALSAFAANAADATVTSNVIVGSGVTNGGFTVNGGVGGVNGRVELGLRARERYTDPVAGVYAPSNDWNSNGLGTYNHVTGGFTPSGGANGIAGGSRASWNFDWSINTDPTNVPPGTAVNANAYTYLLSLDFDAGFGTNFQSFDPINLAYADHAFGNNGTLQSAGTVAADAGAYALLVGANNLVQNSWNYDFFDGGSFSFDPNANGNYTIRLQAFSQGAEVSRSQIEVIVGTGAVPEPGSLALIGLGLAGLAVSRRRKQAK